MRRAYRERGVLEPLRDDLARTRPEPHEPDGLAPPTPAAPTLSRRGLLAPRRRAAAALLVVTAGQSIGGPLRRARAAAPRGRPSATGPTASRSTRPPPRRRHHAGDDGPGYRLALRGERRARALAATSCWRCRSTPTTCRSRASRAGRRRSAGPACGCATSPRSPARPAPRRARASRCSRAASLRQATLGHGQVARRALAARAAGQRRRPVARPRLPGADHRPRAARRALHEVGREPDFAAS